MGIYKEAALAALRAQVDVERGMTQGGHHHLNYTITARIKVGHMYMQAKRYIPKSMADEAVMGGEDLLCAHEDMMKDSLAREVFEAACWEARDGNRSHPQRF